MSGPVPSIRRPRSTRPLFGCYRIKPFFSIVQEYPLFLIERFLPKRKHRLWLVFFYLSIWVVTFALVKRRDSVASEIEGWGMPQTIGCGVTYWGRGNACGLDGSECRPFSGSGFPFRCRANCESYHVLNPRAVGNEEVIYAPMVVGGPGTNGSDEAVYRGDSFVCAAAIHAGVISNQNGGCGVVEMIGRDQEYAASKHHGISSVGFNSYFPLSFRFAPDVTCSSSDSRWDKEKEGGVLWSAANVRGCVVVKFGAKTVEAGREWIGSMLDHEGSIASEFGDKALMCLR